MNDSHDEPIEGIDVESAWRTDFAGNAEILYEITLKNRIPRPVSFSRALVRWQYYHGMQSSIGLGDILIKRATYIVDLPLDVDAWHSLTGPIDQEISLQPPVIVPSGTASGPISVTFRLQLHYSFAGRIDWHPCSDWNIYFSVLLGEGSGGMIKVVPESGWR